ncbi:MHYT domain signaling protein [Purpureocillium lavendulum]|uniref:MHYT domain signaling protein n=1 Tax=Purpureocillium lavendulum TaxID=1247861 RepID=A0AB34FBU7_9HYPO|nr:MHYT domain signaling protein [Purpureocillium lavendulum]
MDYGRRSSGSKPASASDEYYPLFHLDMISIVGCPLQPITNRSGFFDNVTFTFQHWQSSYSSKHAASSLPFDLAHRTFRLGTVQIGCKRYIPEEYIASKNRKGRRSWIRAHGLFLTEISPDLRTLQTYWVCSKCDERGKSSMFVASNTTSPIEHLRRSHMITETVHSFGDADEESPCADIHPPAKRRCLEIPTARCNVNKAKELIVGWIVTANLPFTAPSNPYLQRILELHDASLAKEVPWSRQSVRGTMRKLYEAKKGTISRQLEEAVTRISFSFDMWTSPNRYAFLGLHAHYLDASYQVQSRLLALRRVWGCHSGDNQATTVYGIFGEYGIRGRIGAGVCDNVSSNDTCLASLYRQLRPAVTKEDISAHRTRCFGHIINLAARAFLWGEDPDSFEREAFTEAVFQVEERELRLWRKRGAVGKLHNVVRFIRASSQRRELMKSLASDRCDEDDYQLFEEERAAIDLELMQNNETRWNSTFLMIQRAIRKREQIDHFIAYLETKTTEPRQRVPVEDHLSPQDWLLLAEIQSLLKPLYEITMRCQGWAKEGRYGALWEVMIGMEYLLNFFEEQKLLFSPPDANADDTRNAGASATTRHSPLRADQDGGRERHLPEHTRDEYNHQYYSLLGQSPLYTAAVILHPRWNVSWLEANWTSREQLVWLRGAKSCVRKYFEQHYPPKERSDAVTTLIGKVMQPDEPSQFDQWMQSHDRYRMEEDDELGAYMRQAPVRRENLNPILWWRDHQEEYPRLSKFALDILAIPAIVPGLALASDIKYFNLIQVNAASSKKSAMRRHHAEALGAYIKEIFLLGELLGEGVEPSWKLGERRSQNLTFEKWSMFQTLFMEKWPGFAEYHAYDPYWSDHQPAFHAYDHGANIPIEANEALQQLPREARLRGGEDDSDSESSSNVSDGEEEGLSVGDRRGEEDDADVAQQLESLEPLFTGRLEQLRRELELKYNLANVERVSYALAADINCLEGTPVDNEEGSRPEKDALCLLADRTRVTEAYSNARDCNFFPLAFHQRYGNFSSGGPPEFLTNLCTVMRDNMSLQNDGVDVLSFGFFQGYSNIKRSIRSRADDLLATRGIATAALTLPPSEASRSPAYIRARQERLFQRLRGELTPDQPQSSTPFARERQRVEAAMAQEQMAFRMEQVVTVKASRLVPARRTFCSVLYPIFQLMRFFQKESGAYTSILRRFKPAVFPGVLCSFARLFETALGEMDRRFQTRGSEGLDLALSEGVAVLDRLGNYCFTGDARVLPKTVLNPLVTMESLRKGAWPFVSPDMLDFRTQSGTMNVARWPRASDNRPILLHVAALAYHYGPLVATNRHSQIWFGQLGGRAIRDIRIAVHFLEEVFRDLWIPQMVAFIAFQLRRQLNRRARSGAPSVEYIQQSERISAVLSAWEESEKPFSKQQYDKLFGHAAPRGCGIASVSVSSKARQDFAREVFEACSNPKESAAQSVSSTHGTWHLVLRGAIEHTSEEDVSKEDWITGLTTAMASVGIEWAPGSHRSKLTSKRVVQLAGVAQKTTFIAAPPGSLKRQAMEAENRMIEQEQQPKRARRRIVDFGCEIPFAAIPKLILNGLLKHYKNFQSRDPRVMTHYHAAHNCLVGCLGDYRCDLMLMMVLTIAASSVTPVVRRDEQQYGTNNRMLRALGWIEVVKGNRDSPRNSDCKLRKEEELHALRAKLMRSRKHPEAFIAMVFDSDDRIWADRCIAIIKDRQGD